MIFKKCVIVVTSLCLLLLSGCASLRTPNPSERFVKQTPAERQVALSKIKYWRIIGAFSITQQGRRPEIANYTWYQFNSKNYRINIASAMDWYRVEILRQYGAVTLWKNGTHVSSAKTPKGLMQKALGWSLPISELSDWIKGEPAQHGGFYAAGYDEYGHLTVLRQAGWVVNYAAYRINPQGVDFPNAITLRRPGLTVKIVVKNWMLLLQPDVRPDVT